MTDGIVPPADPGQPGPGLTDPGLVVTGLAKAWAPGRAPVFADVDFSLSRTGRLALLGRNGQGKSTLIKVLGGVLRPTAGQVRWRMPASWPIGFGGGFQGSLSGLDNIRFLARLYERDFDHLLARVDDFAELGQALKQPVKHYSSGMRARLAFGLSLAIEFDCYLIDEVVAVGDARFQEKCREELFARRADRAFIMASHDTHLVERECDRALILEGGQARLYDNVHEAVEAYGFLRAA